MKTKSELVELMKGEADAARAILDAAESAGRDLNVDERAAFDRHIKQAGSYKRQIEEVAVRAAITDLGNQIGGVATKAPDRPQWAAKGRGPSEWVKNVAERIDKVAENRGGAKAITSGTIGVPTPIRSDIIGMPDYPTRLLDLLVDRQPVSGTGDFSFLRQTVRTNNAAPVADNATKPTSVYTFTEETDKVHVIAHLSEAIPLRFLDDYSGVQQFLSDEMELGLIQAVEDQVVTGDGTGENMTGITATSGVLTQAWSTDLLTTLRKAATTMEIVGETPNAWVIHPSDVEVLDLLQDNEARHYFAGPQQQLTTAPVWSLPIVKSVAVTAGQAILADWNYVRLIVREDSRFDIDTGGTLFEKNQFKARLEGRYGCAVLRPSAFCLVDTAA